VGWCGGGCKGVGLAWEEEVGGRAAAGERGERLGRGAAVGSGRGGVGEGADVAGRAGGRAVFLRSRAEAARIAG